MPKKTVLKLMAASDNLWAMQPGAFSAFIEAMQMEAKSLAQPLAALPPYGCGIPLAGAFEDSGETMPYQLENGVAIIPVDGVILRRQFWGFGAGLQEIGNALSAALADHEVRAILFNICSPGGQARGVKELADAIFAARAFKPCAAWVDGLCASAAYWLASACGRIYAGPSSEVGSIGVILRHMDKSGLNKECGLNFTYITAGSHKAIGNPDSALSESDLAVLQARVDAIYEMFCGDVARHMGLALENRLAWADGRDFLAGEAESLGLVTSLVANRAEAISNLIKESFMDKTELAQKHPELLASIEEEAKSAALQDAAKNTENAVKEAVSNTLAIMETACGKEAADKVRALVATGMTPAQMEAVAKVFPVYSQNNPRSNGEADTQSPQGGGRIRTPEEPATAAHKQMLEAIKQATPGAVSANAPAEDEVAAFIKRVGAM